MMKVLLLLSFGALALGSPFDVMIIDGNVADIDDFPYIGSLRQSDQHICGCSILNKNTILTAAHCVEDVPYEELSVRVGNARSAKGERQRVKSVHPHPDYNTTSVDFDICVIKLAKNIVFKPSVQPINMIATGEELKDGSSAVVSGWGATVAGSKENSPVLREVSVNIISDADCKKLFGANRITKNMFCAKAPGKDSCKGDSGGPFVQDKKLIGVVSWSIGCARPEYAGVYTKLSVLRPWVEKFMN